MRRVDISRHGFDQDNYFIHLARYMFAARQLRKDFRVIEIGCGTGYGARLLSDFCSEVSAIDEDYENLENSWSDFNKTNLKFYKTVPEGEKYDAVISFEVVEHIHLDEIDSYFETIKSLMNVHSTLHISTPRALPFNERGTNRQKHHIYEYNYEEFQSLLQKYFYNSYIFSQNDSIIGSQNPQMAWNFVAICTGPK